MSHSYSISGNTTQPTNHEAVSSSVHAGVKVLAVIIGLTAALAVAGAAPATHPCFRAGRRAEGDPGRARVGPDRRRDRKRRPRGDRTCGASRSHAPERAARARRGRARTARIVQRPPDGPARAHADRPAPGEQPTTSRSTTRRRPKTDVTDADGVVYRYFPGRCLEFHPLANFGALNARIAANDAAGRTATRRRVDRHAASLSAAAASPGSTTSTTPAAAHRGCPGWRRPWRRRRSRARRRSFRARRPP